MAGGNAAVWRHKGMSFKIGEVGKMKYFKLLTMMVFALCLLPAGNLYAGSNSAGADYLVKIGERELQQGRAADAVHEFSKALMLDPNHQRAKAYLSQYGIEEGLYSTNQTVTSRLVQDSQALAYYKEMANLIAQERDQLKKQLADVVQERNQFELEAQAAGLRQDQLLEKVADEEYKVSLLQNHLKKIETMVTGSSIYNMEMTYKDQLDEIRDYVAYKLDDLDPEDMLTTLGKSYLDLQASYKNLYSNFLQQREAYQQMAQKVDDYVNVRQHELGRQSDEIVGKDVDLAVKNHHLIKMMKEVESFQNLVERYSQYLAVKDRLMQEKLKELNNLKLKLVSQNKAMEIQDKVILNQHQDIISFAKDVEQLEQKMNN